MAAWTWPGSLLETWVLLAFVVWIVLLAGFRQAGTVGRAVVALLSWVVARVALIAAPIVVRWIGR